MGKWYNNAIYNAEKKQAIIELKKRMNQTFPDYSFDDRYITDTFNNYLDISMRLKKSFTGTDPQEWNIILSDIWVSAIYMVINNFSAETTLEQVRATLKPGTGPWNRDQIVMTLNAIMSLKDDPIYDKYYAPYKFSGGQASSPVDTPTSVSTATKNISTVTSKKEFPIMYVAIGGAVLLGLFLFMKKK